MKCPLPLRWLVCPSAIVFGYCLQSDWIAAVPLTTSTIIRTIISGDGTQGLRLTFDHLANGHWRVGCEEKESKSITGELPTNQLFIFMTTRAIQIQRYRNNSGEGKAGVGCWLVHNNQMWVSIPLTDKNWKSTRLFSLQRYKTNQPTLPQCLLAAGPHLHGNGFGIMFHYLFLITFCGFFCSHVAQMKKNSHWTLAGYAIQSVRSVIALIMCINHSLMDGFGLPHFSHWDQPISGDNPQIVLLFRIIICTRIVRWSSNWQVN